MKDVYEKLDKLIELREVRHALVELEQEEALIKGVKAHNLYRYKINPLTDPSSIASLTTEYIDKLTAEL